MASFTARFTVTAVDPSDLPGVTGDWASALRMRKSYTDGIVGDAELHFVFSGEEPSRGYLAVERITGSIDGVQGEVTVHHGALQHPGGESSFGYVIPGTGSGPFVGWEGDVAISHGEDGTSMVFTLR